MNDEIDWYDPRYLEIQNKLEDAWTLALSGRITWSKLSDLGDWLREISDEHEQNK